MYRFLVHTGSAFRHADNPFLNDFANTLRPLYRVPSAYVMTSTLLPAEDARIILHEQRRLQEHKSDYFTLLVDGWEDSARRSLYGTLAARRTETPVVLNLEDMTGKRADGPAIVDVLENGMKVMGLDPHQVVAVVSDDPTLMRLVRRLMIQRYIWMIVS